MNFLNRDQRGDTIIEVLISIAIVSFIISGAYVVTNRNTQQIRRAQERTQAQKLNSAGVEQLSVALNAVPNSAITGGSVFCFSSGVAIVGTATPIAVLPALSSDAFAYVPGCSTVSGVTYFTMIERTSTSFNNYLGNSQTIHTYIVRTRWSGLGTGNQEVTFTYRSNK